MKKLYIETYGCQMNFADSEIVASVLNNEYEITQDIKEADLVFVNTCSIRDHAEKRVINRLQEFKHLKKLNPKLKIGVLGCMAERMKESLLTQEKHVDMIVGPDAYRDLPAMLHQAEDGRKLANVVLSLEETYDDINPVRLESNGVSAFISIMRGCDNFCSYCVVPFTRGRERSRKPETIIEEARNLFSKGYKEVTLLGQNVNSYNYKNEKDEEFNFAKLMKEVASIDVDLRVRFATSHPKDISDELIKTIAETSNICNSIHLPVQSGSSIMLKKMHRRYDRELYLNRIEKIKELIPNCGLSTDIIAGFCSENEDDHQQTLSLMQAVGYDYAFMFKYSERPDTLAAKKYPDDVPEEIKSKRLDEIIKLQQQLSHISNKNDIGRVVRVLVDNISKKSSDYLSGRSDENKVVVFPKMNAKIGDYVNVLIKECTTATLKGVIV